MGRICLLMGGLLLMRRMNEVLRGYVLSAEHPVSLPLKE